MPLSCTSPQFFWVMPLYNRQDDLPGAIASIQVMAAPHRGFSRSLESALGLARGAYLGWVDNNNLAAGA
jgi:hypothetical protein